MTNNLFIGVANVRVLATISFVGMLLSASHSVADENLRRRGETLLQANCGTCHAIDTVQSSPHREAPPFRTLATRYPVDFLAEALAEGLSTGHQDMPEFIFPVDDVAAILVYFRSIQTPEKEQ
jgi:cytochrome c